MQLTIRSLVFIVRDQGRNVRMVHPAPGRVLLFEERLGGMRLVQVQISICLIGFAYDFASVKFGRRLGPNTPYVRC